MRGLGELGVVMVKGQDLPYASHPVGQAVMPQDVVHIGYREVTTSHNGYGVQMFKQNGGLISRIQTKQGGSTRMLCVCVCLCLCMCVSVCLSVQSVS